MEKTLTEPPINHIPEVRERKLLSGEKVSIPAGSAKLEKIRESDYTTYESKRKFICESFKIDENEISNPDEKHKGEVNQNVPGKLLDSGIAS